MAITAETHLCWCFEREDKLIAALTRKKKDGTLYTRPDNVEGLLPALGELPRDGLLERARICNRKDPGYVPSECLVHFIRASRHENAHAWFDRLYKVLAERVMRAVPIASGGTVSATNERIRDAVFDRFVELLAQDRAESDDRLDFFEARFDLAIKRLRLDAQERVWRETNRGDSMDDEEGGAAETAVAAGTTNRLDAEIFSDPLFRETLYVAIDVLPPEQSRTMHLLLIGWQIHSSDPSVMTIAKALQCSDRSVRNYRDRALKTLGALFNPGDDE